MLACYLRNWVRGWKSWSSDFPSWDHLLKIPSISSLCLIFTWSLQKPDQQIPHALDSASCNPSHFPYFQTNENWQFKWNPFLFCLRSVAILSKTAFFHFWKLLHQFFTWTVLFVLPTVARLKLCCWLGFESPLQLDILDFQRYFFNDILGFQRYFRLSTMSKVEYFKVWPISAIKCDWQWNLKYYSCNLKVTSSNLVTTLLIFLTWNAF